MYKVHQGATLIPVELTAPEYKVDQSSVPSLSASASRDNEGRLHLSIVNLDPNLPAEISTTVTDSTIKSVTGEVLTASQRNAMNTFENPNTIKPTSSSAFKVQGSQLTLSIPAKSVVVLHL